MPGRTRVGVSGSASAYAGFVAKSELQQLAATADVIVKIGADDYVVKIPADDQRIVP